ncbi:MAG: cytochrome P450, partial [Pseudomonadota bacterium]
LLQQQPLDQATSIFQATNDLALKISSKALLGLETSSGTRHLADVMRAILEGMFSKLSLVPVDLPGTPYRQQRQRMETVERMLSAEIETKRRTPDDSILSTLITATDEEGSKFTDAELISNTFLLFFAGHDTAACTLAWLLFLIGQHPEVEQRLIQEIRDHVGDAYPRYEQVAEMPYLDHVVKEGMRVLPASVVFPRFAAEDTALGGYHVPAGTEVLFSPLMAHHEAHVYPQPRRFDPDRWEDIQPGRFEFLPFGGGARRCLGMPFSDHMIRLVLAMIVPRLRFEVPAKTRVDVQVNVVMSPANGLPAIARRPDPNRRSTHHPVRGFIHELVDLPSARSVKQQ